MVGRADLVLLTTRTFDEGCEAATRPSRQLIAVQTPGCLIGISRRSEVEEQSATIFPDSALAMDVEIAEQKLQIVLCGTIDGLGSTQSYYLRREGNVWGVLARGTTSSRKASLSQCPSASRKASTHSPLCNYSGTVSVPLASLQTGITAGVVGT